jgi:hypothetical protein
MLGYSGKKGVLIVTFRDSVSELLTDKGCIHTNTGNTAKTECSQLSNGNITVYLTNDASSAQRQTGYKVAYRAVPSREHVQTLYENEVTFIQEKYFISRSTYIFFPYTCKYIYTHIHTYICYRIKYFPLKKQLYGLSKR